MSNKWPGPLSHFIQWLPAGIVEDTYEFLVAAALAFAGLVQFILPCLLEPKFIHHATVLPVWLVAIWGGFFLVGGVMTSLGVLMRGKRGLRHLNRTIESAGLSLLGTATLMYAVLALLTLHSLSGTASALILLAIGVGFVLRVVILMPGVYERVLRNELEREVNRITRGA